jgi:hypothetical protein
LSQEVDPFKIDIYRVVIPIAIKTDLGPQNVVLRVWKEKRVSLDFKY